MILYIHTYMLCNSLAFKYVYIYICVYAFHSSICMYPLVNIQKTEHHHAINGQININQRTKLPFSIANCQRLPKGIILIELDDGKIYRKALYLMVKTMVSCRFSLKPIQ